MIAGAQKRALGNAHVALDFDHRKVEQPAFLPEPDMISYLEPPREFYPDIWFYDYSCTDSCAEGSKQSCLQPGETQRAASKNHEVEQQPDGLLQPGSAAIEGTRRE